MASVTPTVFVVDPDAAVRQSLANAIRRAGWSPEIASSARAFTVRPRLQAPSCLLLNVGDVRPDRNGLELLRWIAIERRDIPVVAMSAEPSIGLTVRAMQAGAHEFVMKPLTPKVLRPAVERALGQSQAVLEEEADLLELRNRYASLSERERQVMLRVVSGFPNKQVGADLKISVITVKAHRGRVMRKMGAGSLADLVIMALRLGLPRMALPPRATPSIPWRMPCES